MTLDLATNGYLNPESLPVNGYFDIGISVINPQTTKTNLFRDMEIFVNEKRNEVALIPITYTINDTDEIISMFATPAMTVYRYNDRNNASIRKEVRDFLINVSDAVTSENVRWTPAVGDIIQESTGIAEFFYEVSAFNKEPHVKFSGFYRQAYRIHTKRIDREDGND